MEHRVAQMHRDARAHEGHNVDTEEAMPMVNCSAKGLLMDAQGDTAPYRQGCIHGRLAEVSCDASENELREDGRAQLAIPVRKWLTERRLDQPGRDPSRSRGGGTSP